MASKKKPIIISTGIAEIEDIELAVETCKKEGNNNIALLKCTSSYPAPIEEANICMVKDLADRFNVVSGISDHTIGSTVPIVATSFGAKIIEKHFILDRSYGGPDASFSMNETEFKSMVKSIRDAESAIGNVDYNLTSKQKKGRNYSRSLYVSEKIKAGEVLTKKNFKSVRPGYGLHPKYYNIVLGKKVKRNLDIGDRLLFEDIE